MGADKTEFAARQVAIRLVVEECMSEDVCAEAIIARLALRLDRMLGSKQLARILRDTAPHFSKPERVRQAAGLLDRRPDVFATLQATGSAVQHRREGGETDAAVIMRLASSFDAAADISPAASVQLASLGDEARLSTATDEIVAWLGAQAFLGTERCVLDIGCGIGRFELALSGSFGRIVGIDISQRMIAIARKRCAELCNVELRQTSGFDLAGFEEASFDCVLAVDVFPYLVLAGVAEQAFSEIARVLKRPGWLALLSYSYRGSVLQDHTDLRRLAAAHGLQVLVDGEKPFRQWDGEAFLVAKTREQYRPVPVW